MRVTIEERRNELENEIKEFLKQNRPEVICDKKEVRHTIKGIPGGKILKPEYL